MVSGASAAERLFPASAGVKGYLLTLRAVIEDPAIPSVGGAIQYGYFDNQGFRKYRSLEISGSAIHHWLWAL
jgi:hypothetical protein